MLSSARELATKAIQKAQKKNKRLYDRKATDRKLRVGDWVLVKFPHEETGRYRKLSQPWHGPYRVVECRDPDITVVNVYFPQDKPIQIHQTRVTPCLVDIPSGYYWYGRKRHSPGKPPRWIEGIGGTTEDHGNSVSQESRDPVPEDVDQSGNEDAGESSDTDSGENESDHDQEEQVPEEPELPRSTSRYPLRRRVRPPSRF